MKKNTLKKAMALALAGMMALSVAACGQPSDTEPLEAASNPVEEETDEAITLTIWNTEVTTPGIQDNDVARVIEEKLGIKMDIVQGDSQKFSVLVAGGDLPDIIYTNPAQQGVEANALITSGQLIAMDDLIDQYGENIKKNFPSRLDYSKKYVSNGEDKTYFIPVLCYTVDEENPDISYTIENVGLMTRWDVYAAIGYPEIQTTDDYLDVLKQMQDYARENEDVYKRQYQILKDNNQGACSAGWLQVWSPGLMSQMQCDLSVMISEDDFNTFAMPELRKQCDFLQFPLYHFDGQEQRRHLQSLLSLEKLRVIQWTSVVGQPSPVEYLPALQAMQKAGKSIFLMLKPYEIEPIMQGLSSKGLHFSVEAQSVEEADAIVKLVEKLSHE